MKKSATRDKDVNRVWDTGPRGDRERATLPGIVFVTPESKHYHLSASACEERKKKERWGNLGLKWQTTQPAAWQTTLPLLVNATDFISMTTVK